MRVLIIFFVSTVRLLTPGFSTAQEPDSVYAKKLVERVIASYVGLEDYSVEIHAEVDMYRVNVPPMDARLYYRRPNEVAFKAEEFVLLPKEGVAFDPSILPVDTLPYSAFSVEGEGWIDGVAVKKVRVKLKRWERSGGTEFWIDPVELVIRKVKKRLGENGDITVKFEYLQVGEYRLPSQIIVTIDLPPGLLRGSPFSARDDPDENDEPQAEHATRGSVTIRYSNYELNKGIPDEVFETNFPLRE